MDSSITSFVGSTVTVALIVIATRWLISAKGAQLPKICDSVTVYGVKPAWRGLGLAVEVFWTVVIIWSWHDLHRPDWGLIALFAAFGLLALTISIGSVSTDQAGITYKFLWRTRRLLWKDVTEIRLHKRDGGCIELRSVTRKIMVDSRFVAPEHLLEEIQKQTGLQPVRSSS